MTLRTVSLLDDVVWPPYLADVHVQPVEDVASPDATPKTDTPAEPSSRPNHLAYQTREALAGFYTDDRTFTAAALDLHPLLDADTVAAISSVLAGVEAVPPDEALLELGHDARAVHLLISGDLKVVAVKNAGRPDEVREEITRFRRGQWIGLPALLRAWDDRFTQRGPWPKDEALRLEIVV